MLQHPSCWHVWRSLLCLFLPGWTLEDELLQWLRLSLVPGWTRSVPDGGRPSLPSLRRLDLQCPGVLTTLIVYIIRRGGRPCHELPAMGVATHQNQTCIPVPRLGYTESPDHSLFDPCFACVLRGYPGGTLWLHPSGGFTGCKSPATVVMAVKRIVTTSKAKVVLVTGLVM
jgi:hypothetical protein